MPLFWYQSWSAFSCAKQSFYTTVLHLVSSLPPYSITSWCHWPVCLFSGIATWYTTWPFGDHHCCCGNSVIFYPVLLVFLGSCSKHCTLLILCDYASWCLTSCQVEFLITCRAPFPSLVKEHKFPIFGLSFPTWGFMLESFPLLSRIVYPMFLITI